MPRKRTKSNNKAFQKFTGQVELIGLGVNNASCVLDRSRYASLRDKKDSTVRQIKTTFSVDKLGTNYFEGSVKFTLSVQDRTEESNLLGIQCTFGTHFHFPEPIEREFASRFIESFVGIITWPYFRQFVSDCTARMSIPQITLPLLPENLET